MTDTMTAPLDLAAGDRTLNPADRAARLVLAPLPGDPEGRVIVRLADAAEAVLSDTWHDTTDERTGLAVQVRRADCGAGCRCAAEVRLDPSLPDPVAEAATHVASQAARALADEHCAHDVAGLFTCDEADAVAAFLAVYAPKGQHDAINWLLSHAFSDDEGDRHAPIVEANNQHGLYSDEAARAAYAHLAAYAYLAAHVI